MKEKLKWDNVRPLTKEETKELKDTIKILETLYEKPLPIVS